MAKRRKSSQLSQHRGVKEAYSRFEKIDGRHPWSEEVDDGAILYPVRELRQGKVMYFNFWLAKEMGLIPAGHPHRMNQKLQKKIIKTFALQIINEYDQLNKKEFPKSVVKPNKYMATRYLQLQHNDKRGKTSGDGRSIWNGSITYRGTTWDVSSRGTGVTALAPGAVEAGKPLESGDESFGYGCGMAELDELVATAILSEVMYNQNLKTERMLAVIDIGNGLGIGIRAAPNLIRPAHIFRFLKLGDRENLKKSCQYLINRQVNNGEWDFSPRSPKRFKLMVNNICDEFAEFAARLDVDYIFAWLDWDGDNVLANAGIIDYGSIRQFGVRHDNYRYEDTDRYSTNLNEQKQKARLIVQIFQQCADFILTKKKKPLSEYANHSITEMFNRQFEMHRLNQLVFRLGFVDADREKLMGRHLDLVKEFDGIYSYFERAKTHKKESRTDDGVNRPAIFCMRDGVREMAQHFRDNPEDRLIDAVKLFHILLADTATKRDAVFQPHLEERLVEIQVKYLEMISKVRGRRSFKRYMNSLVARSNVINRKDRLTGNSITVITEHILEAKAKRLTPNEFQGIIETIIETQTLTPEKGVPDPTSILKKQSQSTRRVLKSLLEIAEEYAHDI